MTNICSKVTVRKRPIKNGQISLYLDFYPAIRHPRTGKMTRREYLGIYIYAEPKEQFEVEYNNGMLKKAELIKCRRMESIINDEYGFLDRGNKRGSFLQYFKNTVKEHPVNKRLWKIALKNFEDYCDGECPFTSLTVKFCQGYLDFLTGDTNNEKSPHVKGTTANSRLIVLKSVLRTAFDEGYIKENISDRLVWSKEKGSKREFLSLEEVKTLAATPCKSDVVKRATWFSCLTGLRISDIILLQWENIEKAADGGWCMNICTKKTKTRAILPLSDEALSYCGERGEGQVFKGLTEHVVRNNLHDWLTAAGITKPITFHCFRHTFATLQISAGTDIYTVSKLLTHSNVGTTQIYAEVVNDLKRDASKRISLK